MPSVLFVDDEQRILDGLRRSLGRRRPSWSLRFATSGAQALTLMAEEPASVVIADARMPRMSGYELLSRVQCEYPDTVRVLFSGQTERDVTLKALAVAHQFLSKPVGLEELEQVIDRADQLRTLLGESELRSLVSGLATLPAQPHLFTRLTELLQQDETSVEEVSALVESDVAVSARVLQVVNSAFFVLPRKVSDLRQAVTWVGFHMLRSLVLVAECLRPYEGHPKLPARMLEDLSVHSMQVAALARKLEPAGPKLEEAYLAGLLHDMGRLALASQVPEQLAEVLAIEEQGGDSIAAERRLWGATHGEVGAFLAGNWGLSQGIVEALAFHHEPSRSRVARPGALAAVHIAQELLLEAQGRPSRLDLEWVERIGMFSVLARGRALAERAVSEQA